MKETITKQWKPRVGGLVGRWFHSIDPATKKVHWQGQIIAKPAKDTYLVQLYSWLDGGPTNQQFVSLGDMKDWQLYDTHEDMNFNYEYRLKPRPEQR